MNARSVIAWYKKLSDPVKAGFWFTICFVLSSGLQFLGMPIYTRLMSQTDYGIYSTFSSWAHVLVIISSLNIYSGIFNKAMIKYDDGKDAYVSSIQTLTLLSSLLMAGLIVFLREPLSEMLNMDQRCLLAMGLYLITFPQIQYWSQRNKFEFKYRPIITLTVINSFLNLGIGILFVVFSENEKGIALVYASVLVQTGISLCLYFVILYRGKKVFNKEQWIWSLGMAIPLLPHYLSQVLLGHSDRIMINSMSGSDKAAIYNIAYQISMVMTIVRTGVNGAFLPWEYKTIKSKDYQSLRSTTNIYAILMFAMTFLFMLVGPEMLRIVAPLSYYEALYDVPAIMAGCFFIFAYVLFVNIEVYYEKKQYVAIASLIAAVINIILNYICIKQWGYLAAGYTTAVSYAVMIALHYAFFRRIQKVNSEVAEFYDLKVLMGLIIATAIAALFSLFLYQHMVLRYLLLIAMIVLALVNRRKIMRLMKLLKKDRA